MIMKTKFFLLVALLAVVLGGCKPNEPEVEIKTYVMGNITFSYYLSDKEGNRKNTFTQNEWLRVNLTIENEGQDTLLVNADYLGNLGCCYDNGGQFVESMSAYVHNDTLPVFKPSYNNSPSLFSYVFYVDAPTGSYHYQNPYVVFYVKGNENEINEITVPLTINFKIK
jgi:hypothetical protein